MNSANKPPSATRWATPAREMSVVTDQGGPAARRRQEPEEGADRDRLSGAVRPEEAEHLAILDGKRHVFDPANVAVVLRQGPTFDGGHTARNSALRLKKWAESPD
jgi:hypothetical protein